jgi:shikimate dehydrogenase
MGGFNLTVPLKEHALPLLDAVTPLARRIGAVNTVKLADGRLLGDNTDAPGFLRSLGGRLRLRGGRAVLIGAGGSARAVGAALVEAGCEEIVVANRTPSRGEALAAWLRDDLGARAVETVPLAALRRSPPLRDARLVVNTTSAGLAGKALPVRAGAAPRRCLFVDLVYARTPFLAAAARAGRPTLDGSGMLLHQGALAFAWWTGRRAPLGVMAAALRAGGSRAPRSAPAGMRRRRGVV